MLFKIEKNIPIPGFEFQPHGRKYPIAEMKIGDSFLVTPSAECRDIRKLALRVGVVAAQYKTKHPDFEYIIRQFSNGARLWRIPKGSKLERRGGVNRKPRKARSVPVDVRGLPADPALNNGGQHAMPVA